MFEKSLQEWISSFPGSSGNKLLFNSLSEILMKCDSNWFSAIGKPLKESSNWVLEYNALKRLFKLLIAYYHEIMNQSTANLEMPDLTLLARDHHQQEWLKIVILTLGIAVQCPNKSMFIEKIQELSDNAQVDLMHIIEDILSKTVSIDPDQKKQPTCLMEYNSPVPSPVTEKLWNIEGKKLQLDRLSKEVKSLQEENSTLLDENQRLVNEKDCLQDSVDKLNLKISKLNKKIEELAEQPSTNDQDLNVVTTDSRLLQENRHQKELIKSLEEQLMVSVEQNEKLESRASNFNEMKKTLEVMKLKMTEMTTAMEFEISQKEDVERKLESSVKLFAALQEESRQDKAKVSQLQDLLKEAHQNENDGGWYSTINLEEDVSGQNEIQESLQKANNIIKDQELKIKDLIYQDTNIDFSEALKSLTTTLEQRDREIAKLSAELKTTKEVAQKEQKLIISAWYELGLQFQRQAVSSQKAPSSWLQTQRQQLAEDCKKV